MIRAEQLHARIMDELDLSREMEDEDLIRLIYQVLGEASREEHLSLEEKTALGRELFNAFRKLDLLQEFLEDDEITEIMINGTDYIFYEKAGRIWQSDRRFMSREKLEDVIQQIVSGSNRRVNEASPIVDARLPDGSRVHVVLAPVALNGPIVTIRKFSGEAASMEQLISWGSLSREMAKFLSILVAAGYNIFISGGTGSGKTTFLNAMSQYIPRDERIITIEDNAELKIRGIPNLVSLEARNANVEGTGQVTIRDLIKAALRMRPNRIIVGEVRSAEAIDMLQAFNTGHDGSLSTGHANSPRDMLSRLETMVLMGMDLPLAAIQRQIASGVDIIIHLGRLRDKSRKVLEVAEVLGYEKGEIRLETLYRFEEEGTKDGRIQGGWKKCHELACRDKLLAAGYDPERVDLDRREGGSDHGSHGLALLPESVGGTFFDPSVGLAFSHDGGSSLQEKGGRICKTI
ncbi:CpaF family protein [uncultured Merdimonas sp.]|uniref:CpaF family protein n=1 Tax=uncultured Merdimonas sp. TaxID=2023269 RepID=UPI003209EB8C